MDKMALITGAYGFIGRHAAKAYKAAGYTVVGIGHGVWNKKEYVQWGIDRWHTVDICFESLRSFADKPDVIIHCAGGSSVGESVRDPQLDAKRTLLSISAVLEYIRICSPDSKLIYPSSAAVYGETAALPISEDSRLLPISFYGLHKKMAEEMCGYYGRQFGVRTIVIRLFSVYGEGLRKQLLWDACNKIVSGNHTFFGTGQEKRDWIHIDDVCAVLYLAKDKAGADCPVFNVGCGEAVSIKDILAILFACFGERKQAAFDKQENKGNPHAYQADVSGILSWNWRPKVALKDGIYQYVEWYKKNEKNKSCVFL